MARIQLRDVTIYLQDGLSGTSAVEDGNSSLAVPPVSTTTDGAASPATDEIQVLAQYVRTTSGGTYTLRFSDGVNPAFTTLGIADTAAAAAIQTAVDTAAVGYPAYVAGHIVVTESGAAGISDGTVTLTFSGASVSSKPWDSTIIDAGGVTVASITVGMTLGVDTTVLNSTDTDKWPVGARFTVAGETGTPVHTVTGRYNNETDVTLAIAFTPTLASVVADDAVITVTNQRLTINIGEGDLSWTESREFIYDLDRDQLDTVRQGPDQPLEMDLNVIYDFITTESGQTITPEDALKNIGEASEWVTSSSDPCEPYAVDIYVVHCVPCGTEQDEDLLFPDFRYESLEASIQDASIAVSGRCNATAVTASRSDISGC